MLSTVIADSTSSLNESGWWDRLTWPQAAVIIVAIIAVLIGVVAFFRSLD